MPERDETASLSGGCACLMHPLLMPTGVIFTQNGSMGGEGERPTVEAPRGRAEVVKVVFDPEQLC
jgi:peptide methionine sulfoxide reductase MsrA